MHWLIDQRKILSIEWCLLWFSNTARPQLLCSDKPLWAVRFLWQEWSMCLECIRMHCQFMLRATGVFTIGYDWRLFPERRRGSRWVMASDSKQHLVIWCPFRHRDCHHGIPLQWYEHRNDHRFVKSSSEINKKHPLSRFLVVTWPKTSESRTTYTRAISSKWKDKVFLFLYSNGTPIPGMKASTETSLPPMVAFTRDSAFEVHSKLRMTKGKACSRLDDFLWLRSFSAIFNPKICPTASWSALGISVASFPEIHPNDFFVNENGDIYVPDEDNHLIRKYSSLNDQAWITVAGPDLLEQPTLIFVTRDQDIYIWDSKAYRVSLWSSVSHTGRTVLSFDGCRESVEFRDICFASSLFVDDNQSIYISESNKKYPHANRVMKFDVNQTVGRVMAGSYTYGSQAKQLESPRTIWVDQQGRLYVADIDNSRIQQFLPGNRNGTTLVTLDGLTDFIVDADGTLFVSVGSEKTIRRMRKIGANFSTEKIMESLDLPSRLRFGYDGSIYVLEENKKRVRKYQIIDNSC